MNDINPENNLDKLVRKRLEGFEMPYDPKAWSQFEARLDAGTAPTKGSSLWNGAAAALIIGAVAVGTYVMWPKAEQPARIETPVPVASTTEAADHDRSVPAEDARTESGNVATVKNQDGTSERTADRSLAKQGEAPSVNQSSPEPKRETAIAVEPQSTAGTNEDRRPLNLNLQLKMSRNSVCAGEEVRLMAVTGTGGLNFEWHFSDGEKRYRSETARHFDVPGTYDVTLTATRDGQTWERQASIEVRPSPSAEFEMVRPYAGIPLYHVSAAAQAGQQYRWTFSDGRVSTEQETRQLYRRRGEAGVELIVTNQQGCTSVARRTEQVSEDFRLFAVNTFTPNGDGKNDDFIPKALEVMDCGFEMVIKDLNNRELYRTSSVDQPWNGRENNNGNMLPAGPYIWTVVLKDNLLQDPVFRGEITLQP